MLYLSQRKISQITRMDDREQRDGQPPAGYQRQPAPVANPPASALRQPAPPRPADRQPAGAGWRRSSAWGEEDQDYQPPASIRPDERFRHTTATVPRLIERAPAGQVPAHPQPLQPNQPQPPTPSNPNRLRVNVDQEGKKYLNTEITKTDDEIKENRKSLKSRLMIAAFLGFCSIAIGIGTNMKYGPGDMSAFESLSGKRGAGGTAENLWNSGSTNDPLRGINYGFAIAGFTLPIVGTIFSLIGAFINFNQIKKGEKKINLCNIAIAGFSISKTPDPSIHPNAEKLQADIKNLNSSPNAEFSPTLAVALAKAHAREIKYLGL